MSGMPIQADRAARFAEMTSVERERDTLEEMFQRMTSRIEGVEGSAGRPEGLPAICASWNIPYGKYMFWLRRDLKRYQVYLDALEIASHADISEVITIADGEKFPQEKRVMIDTRFRVAEAHAEQYRKSVRIDAPSVVLLDAGLVGFASELLGKLGKGRASREIDVTPKPESSEEDWI